MEASPPANGPAAGRTNEQTKKTGNLNPTRHRRGVPRMSEEGRFVSRVAFFFFFHSGRRLSRGGADGSLGSCGVSSLPERCIECVPRRPL